MEQLRFNFEGGEHYFESEQEWEQVTASESVKKQPVFVGYDVWNNFRINFEIINRHNVTLVKSFIFPPDYSQTRRFKTQIVSAEGPIGVNINNDFRTYTEVSRKCFRYLARKAVAIYKEKVERNNNQGNNDQLNLDF
jgi:hypothetical protein